MFKKLLAKIILYIEERQKRRKEKKEQPKSPASKRARRVLWAVCLTGILTCFFTGMTFLWYVFIYVDGEFDLSSLDHSLNYTTVIYGQSGGDMVEVEQLHGSENRRWTNIDDISKHLQDAFVAIEDERFYKHNGVDIRRTAKSVLNFFNPSSTSSFGGSTITQQLVKNLTDDDDHTITRKIQEMRRAWYLESQYRKPQILEVYLNTIYLSQGCYGIETAAEKYFGKTASELSIAESACIASITKYPTYYDPLINFENNQRRTKTVINKMEELGMISAEEAEAAKAEELVFTDGSNKTDEKDIKSYFVDAVTEEVIDDLINKKGYSKLYAESLLYSGGLQIYSTMDVRVQNAVDSIYKDKGNFPNITAYDKNLDKVLPIESAISIVDNSTGACVALYGGIGPKETARGLNRATQGYQQPGSSIKPIATYAPAIEYGVCVDGNNALSPSSMLLDWYIDEEKQYPVNESRIQSNKKVTLTAAVAQSMNTIAARVNVALGTMRSYNFLKDNLGITSLVQSDQNVGALALGGLTKGVTVYEMAAAYSAFANEGTYTKPYLYTKVVDQNGRIILENQIESHTAMSSQTARVMNQLLSYTVSSGTGTPANLHTHETAGKTGTTSGDYDRWFVGYTAQYSAAIWFGYDYDHTVYLAGPNPASLTFKKVMQKVHEGVTPKALAKPTTLVASEYCFESGMLLSDKCTQKANGQFVPGGVPTQVCNIHEPQAEVPGVTTPETDKTPTVQTPSTDDNKKPTTSKPVTKPETDKNPTTSKPTTKPETDKKPTTSKPVTKPEAEKNPTTSKPVTKPETSTPETTPETQTPETPTPETPTPETPIPETVPEPEDTPTIETPTPEAEPTPETVPESVPEDKPVESPESVPEDKPVESPESTPKDEQTVAPEGDLAE